MTPLAPAIFPAIETRQIYDHTEENGGDPIAGHAGTSSFDYSKPYDTFSIVTEVAYFDDPRVMDQTPTETIRRDAILASVDRSEASRPKTSTIATRMSFPADNCNVSQRFGRPCLSRACW
jgi:hypothetical protein